MSTPSASAVSQKAAALQAQNGATTPNYSHLTAFSSPAPRSVPSPAAHRVQAGKSPFNAASQAQSAAASGSQTQHVGSSSIGAKHLGSSPAPGMINFDSPAALGLSLSNMGVMEGGVGMGISMSGMSMGGLSGLELVGSSMGGRGDEEERRRRLEAVLTLLSDKPSHVSQEGVERQSRKCGLEVMWEDARKDGGRLLSIAGQTVIVDVSLPSGRRLRNCALLTCAQVEFKANTVQRTTLSLPSSTEAVAAFAEPASRILQDDLTPPPGIATINYTLEKFAKNLERIARLDRLSTTEVNCIDAISGVYHSLKRLYDHEKNVAMTLLDASRDRVDAKAEREVLCKNSGRPRMHGNGVIGLSLDYWMERRRIFKNGAASRRKSASAQGESRMDIDSGSGKPEEEDNKVFSLTIDCESCPAELYPPMRISDAWVSPLVEIPTQDTGPFAAPSIDWLDPPPTYGPDNMNVQSGALTLGSTAVGKLPNVRFVAKLNPPLVVPLQIAMQLMHDAQAPVAPESVRPTTYDGLMFRRDVHTGESPPVVTAGEIRAIRCERKVLVPKDDGQETDVTHDCSLYFPKLEYARVLETIPFSHPRQIVQMLPVSNWSTLTDLTFDFAVC